MNLLIGGTGFIGTALAQAMVKRGEKVTSLSLEQTKSVEGVNHLTIDLTSQPLPAPLLQEATDVFVLVGQHRPGFEVEQEKRVVKELAKRLAGASGKIYFFSSALVYGDRLTAAKESAEPQPVGVYAKFKLDSEAVMREFIPANRLAILRLANVYGSPKNRGIIGLLMAQLANKETMPLTLNDQGEIKRDYIFIDDLAEAVMSIKDTTSAAGIINVATGQSHSLKEVVEALEKVSGQKIAYKLATTALDEVKIMLLSNSLLGDRYGCKDFALLEDGLKATMKRYQEESNHVSS